MKYKMLKSVLVFCLIIGFSSAIYSQNELPEMKYKKVEKERINFKQLIIQNPNYFGTCPQVDLKPIKKMKLKTKYEQLKCVGFLPEQDLLEAIVDVKLPYGYLGNLCSPGSFEYVRFFADWNGNGDFIDPGEDLGIVSVNVHDIPNTADACRKKSKPLSYALTLKVDPKKYLCFKENLVKVRAILSWNVVPTAGDPNYVPVWGNIVEKWIQIHPGKFYLKDFIKTIKFEEMQIDTSMLELNIPILKTKDLTQTDLAKLYQNKDVPKLRYGFPEIYQQALSIKQNPGLMVEYKLDPKLTDLVKDIDFICSNKSSARYEELGCVGLNYDLSRLVTTMTVKLPYGYSGTLCKKGSYEYVAFWVYAWDKIEQMCSWKYVGTSKVNVHDIKSIPPEGIQYAVYHPFDFSSYADKCSKPKVLRVRAILSWRVEPSSTNPNYVPVWGNKVDAMIQLKPGYPDKQKPYIWSVGGMAVESISGNPYTVSTSSLGDGYANGPSVTNGYNASESPFGSTITISGTLTKAPNNPSEAGKLRYKVQYKKYGEAGWHDIENKFRIWIRINGIPSGYIDQVATAGYFKYQKDLINPKIVEVDGDVLAVWHTPVAYGDGLYKIRVLLHKPGAMPFPDVPPDHVPSSVIKVMVDNTRPDAQISLDLGACTKFHVGDTVTGKFTATDKHIWKYNVAVEPPVANPPTILPPSSESFPGLTPPGKINQPFTLTTTSGTTPCGYVIKLHVWDRTIRNNYLLGNYKHASVGLCILVED
jgi:hypothetical protein